MKLLTLLFYSIVTNSELVFWYNAMSGTLSTKHYFLSFEVFADDKKNELAV